MNSNRYTYKPNKRYLDPNKLRLIRQQTEKKHFDEYMVAYGNNSPDEKTSTNKSPPLKTKGTPQDCDSSQDSDSDDFNSFFHKEAQKTTQLTPQVKQKNKIELVEDKGSPYIEKSNIHSTPLRKRPRPLHPKYLMHRSSSIKKKKTTMTIDIESDSEESEDYLTQSNSTASRSTNKNWSGDVSSLIQSIDEDTMDDSEEEPMGNVRECIEIDESSSEEEQENEEPVAKKMTPIKQKSWMKKVMDSAPQRLGYYLSPSLPSKKFGNEKETEYDILLKKAISAIESDNERFKREDDTSIRITKDILVVAILSASLVLGKYITNCMREDTHEIMQIWFKKKDLENYNIKGLKMKLYDPIHIDGSLYLAYFHKPIGQLPYQTVEKYKKEMEANSETIIEDIKVQNIDACSIRWRQDHEDGELTFPLAYALRGKSQKELVVEGIVCRVFDNHHIFVQEKSSKTLLLLSLPSSNDVSHLKSSQSFKFNNVIIQRHLPITHSHPLWSFLGHSQKSIVLGQVFGEIELDKEASPLRSYLDPEFSFENATSGRYSFLDIKILYCDIYSVKNYVTLVVCDQQHHLIQFQLLQDSIPKNICQFIESHPPSNPDLTLQASFQGVYFDKTQYKFIVDQYATVSQIQYSPLFDQLPIISTSIRDVEILTIPNNVNDLSPLMPLNMEYYHGCINRYCMGYFSNQTPFFFDTEQDATPQPHRFSFSSSEICCPRCFQTQTANESASYVLVANDDVLIDHWAAQYMIQQYPKASSTDMQFTDLFKLLPNLKCLNFGGILLTPMHYRAELLYHTLLNYGNNGQTPPFLHSWIEKRRHN